MHTDGLLVSNISYYSGSRKTASLRLELVQNLSLLEPKETLAQYLSRMIEAYTNEFISKLENEEKVLLIYLSIITVGRRILVPKQFYSEAEIRTWIQLFSGKRIALNSVLFAKMRDNNVNRIKKLTTKIKIKRLSEQELNFSTEEMLTNKEYSFFSVAREFATFVNGNCGHILGIPWLEINNICQSINSTIISEENNKV